MAIAHRTLSIFDTATDGRMEYVERLQFYFTANGIKFQKMRNVIEQFVDRRHSNRCGA